MNPERAARIENQDAFIDRLPGSHDAPGEILAELRDQPREERRQILSEVRETVRKQSEMLAFFYGSVTELIRKDPDAPLDLIRTGLREIVTDAGIDPDRAAALQDIVTRFGERRDAIREYRTQYPNDKDLFKVIFDRDPKGPVNVIATPAMIYFRCAHFEDYGIAYHEGFGKEIPNQEDAAEYEQFFGEPLATQGFSSSYARDQRLRGAICAGRPDSNSDEWRGMWSDFGKFSLSRPKSPFIDPNTLPLSQRGNILHEEQHSIHRLFEDTLFADRKLARAQDLRHLALQFARLGREDIGDERARTEILAHYVQGYSREETEKRLLATKASYDYFQDDRSQKIADLISIILEPKADESPAAAKLLGRVADPAERKIAVDALVRQVIDQYASVVHSALDALTALEPAYSKQEIVGLLVTEPLRLWSRAAARLLDRKIEKTPQMIQSEND